MLVSSISEWNKIVFVCVNCYGKMWMFCQFCSVKIYTILLNMNDVSNHVTIPTHEYWLEVTVSEWNWYHMVYGRICK